MTIGLVARVKPSHPYLEDDPAPPSTICAFHLGFDLGIPVIFTCRNDKIGELHFDTRQYAHIVWENAEQLRDNLKNRILARIGEGPNAVVRPFSQ